MNNIFSQVVIMMLLFSACNSFKDNTVLTTTPISDPKLLQAVDFKVGSYFLYKDSVNGNIDSFYISEYNHGTGPNDSGGYYESAGYSAIRSKYPKTNMEVTASGNALRAVFTYKADVYSDITLILLPFQDGKQITSPYPIQCVGYYPTYMISNVEYADVYEIVSNYNFHSFYSIESGLIKFSLSLTNGEYHVWELMKSKIVR